MATAQELAQQARAAGWSYAAMERATGIDSSYWSQVGRGKKSGAAHVGTLTKLLAGDVAPPAPAKRGERAAPVIPVQRRTTKAGTLAQVRRSLTYQLPVTRKDRKTGEERTEAVRVTAKETKYARTVHNNLRRNRSKIVRMRVTFREVKQGKSRIQSTQNVAVPLFEHGYNAGTLLDLMEERGQSLFAFLEDQAERSEIVSEARGVESVQFEIMDRYDLPTTD